MIGTEVFAKKYTLPWRTDSDEFYIAKLDDGSILIQHDEFGCFHLLKRENIDRYIRIHTVLERMYRA